MNEAQAHEGTTLADAGRRLWLAGLGAVAEVEKEGRALFDRLVERGRPVEERQKQAASEVADRTGKTVRELGKLLQDTVEYEAKGLIRRFGLLTRDDLRVFSARLAALSQRIDEYAAQREIASREAAGGETRNETADPAPKAARTRQRKTTTGA